MIDSIDQEDNIVKYVISKKDNCDKVKIMICSYVETLLHGINYPCRKMECECLPRKHIFAILQYLNLDVILDMYVALIRKERNSINYIKWKQTL